LQENFTREGKHVTEGRCCLTCAERGLEVRSRIALQNPGPPTTHSFRSTPMDSKWHARREVRVEASGTCGDNLICYNSWMHELVIPRAILAAIRCHNIRRANHSGKSTGGHAAAKRFEVALIKTR